MEPMRSRVQIMVCISAINLLRMGVFCASSRIQFREVHFAFGYGRIKPPVISTKFRKYRRTF